MLKEEAIEMVRAMSELEFANGSGEVMSGLDILANKLERSDFEENRVNAKELAESIQAIYEDHIYKLWGMIYNEK